MIYRCMTRLVRSLFFQVPTLRSTRMGCLPSKYDHPSYAGIRREGKSYGRTGAYFARAGDGGGWVGDTKPVLGGGTGGFGGGGGGDGGGGC